jgi:hypothetical protein
MGKGARIMELVKDPMNQVNALLEATGIVADALSRFGGTASHSFIQFYT